MITKVTKIFFAFLHLSLLVTSFNISPAPNIIIKKPDLSTTIQQSRSSYFGFQINLRRNHILVGAPRAQSTLEQQRKVNETGAIYKCNFEDSQPCHPYHFDLNGNTKVENDLAYNSEKKDFQMLGFAMDGHESEEDKFVVCAPQLKADLEESDHYLLHGICYWVNSTETLQPSSVRQINPLREKTKQTVPGENKTNYYYYIYGESGFSVHITDDNEEIIVGAVGILNWKGSIIRYKGSSRPDLGGLQRRELNPYRHLLRKRQVLEYRSEIPTPFLSTLSDDSYFGYAVSSAKFLGPENDTRFYVASAPQSNHQTGEVFLFDIDDFQFQKKIKVYNKFVGDKFGEYFGYTLICDDFNGDAYPDIIIGAPLHSKTGLYENGAIYVYLNKGGLEFKQQPIILSDYEGSGRFGSTISRIGDINLDGFNDIAVAAPLEEGNGAVYIFLGSAQGISSKPSQKIVAPSELPNPFGDISSMFGYGLSKGVDIDSNGYRDIAVGAPSSEHVYIYRTYPVIKVLASVVTAKNELSLEDSSTVVKICTSLQTMTEISHDIEFSTSIILDAQYSRLSFSPREVDKIMVAKVKMNQQEQCNDYTVFIKGTLNDIFKPVTIDFKYDLVQKIPDYDHKFCETCVAIDPSEPKSTTTKIAFSTGCANERCIADLSVVGTLVNVRQPYVLGSTRTIEIKYEISNSGESAYLTQITITIPQNITDFSRIPSSCRQDAAARSSMICDINHGKPIKNRETVELLINLDASKLEGTLLQIVANVSSAADESNPDDNIYQNEILLTEFSDIELNGLSSDTQLSLEDGLRVENLQYKYKVFNNGPSTVKEISLTIFLPIVYAPFPNYFVNIVNITDLDISGFYINKVLEHKIHNLNSFVQPNENGVMVMRDDINKNFDSSKLGYDYEMNAERPDQDYNNLGQSSHRRRRRHVWREEEPQILRSFNRYTRNVVEEQLASFRAPVVDKEDATLINLPRNRTIIQDCIEHPEDCLEIEFIVRNFRPGSEPIVMNLNFSLNLNKINEIFNEKQNIFLFKSHAKVYRADDVNLQTLKVSLRNPYTIVYEKLVSKTPYWIYIVSIIVGILIVILLSYVFYRLGFFKRAQKEELQKLVRESRNITSEQAEELRNLNTT